MSANAEHIVEHRLGPADLEGALALSGAANWNQCAADWAMMLAAGRGWGLSLADGARRGPLVASTLVLPYPPGFAWISMVLVLPAYRGRGFASRLLRAALADLAARALAPVLDATPAGAPVYRREGFGDAWSFTRWQRSQAGADPRTDAPAPAARPTNAPATVAARALALRPLGDAHWPAVCALDAHAFGADRAWLLRALAQRRPGDAWVACDDDGVAGFVLAREGRVARQVGPLVARRADARVPLLDAAGGTGPGPVFVDAVDDDAALAAALRTRGFAPQRPFTRMTRGGAPAPGEAGRVALVAGPELG